MAAFLSVRRRSLAALTSALLVLVGPTALGQSPSLGRHVPSKGLAFYVEFDGLGAHAAAWRETALHGLLNDTKLGPMLADLGRQVLGEVLKSAPDGAFPATPELTGLLDTVARDGFAFGASAPGGEVPGPPRMAFVIRNGAKNGAVDAIRRFDPKSREVRRGARTLHLTGEGDGESGWWVEGDHLVIAGEPSANIDAILDAADGKAPNAAGLPLVAELKRAGAGFEPVMIAFVDFAGLPMPPEAARLGIDGLKRIDVRWGFQDRALYSSVRVVAPSPRRGVLGLFDGPTFRLGQVPPIPRGIENFSALAVAPDVLYDKIVALARADDPAAGPRIAEAEASIAKALGARLREDVLAGLGPFWVAYGGVEEGGIRGAIVTDVRDPAALAGVLDRLVQLANAQIRAEAARNPRAAQGPVEFRKVEGEAPGYRLILPLGSVPPQVAGLFEPTILVGKSRVAIGMNGDEARAALEVAPWVPPADLAGPLGDLKGDLRMLSLSDPRTTVPEMVEGTPTILLAVNGFIASVHQARLAAARAANRARGVPIPPARPPLVLKVDPEGVPTADAIRPALFRGYMAVTSSDDGFTIVTRDPVPTINPVVASAGLTALLLPAVQAAREAARRSQCVNDLKQIGLALHLYHQSLDGIPPAAIAGKDGKPLLSWRVAILPYVEQQDLYNQFHLDEPWDSPHNKALIPRMPSIYLCPSRSRPEPGTTTYKAFVGGGAAFDQARSVHFREFTDGLSNTLTIVESKTPVVWTKPDDIPFDPKAPASLLDAGSPHPGGFNALMSDGAVRFLKNTIDLKVFHDLITRAGGEVIGPNSF